MFDDRRRHQRIEIALEGLASFGESEPVEVAVENLSQRGVCLSVEGKTRLGDSATLRLWLSSKRAAIPLSGRLVWHQHDPSEANEDGQRWGRVGIEFVDVPFDVGVVLRHFVKRLIVESPTRPDGPWRVPNGRN